MDLCSQCGCPLPDKGDVIHDFPPNMPSWWDAPPWAQYLAADKNGNWWWYEDRPSADNMCCYWRNTRHSARYELAETQPCTGHNKFYTYWMHTLRTRPAEIPNTENDPNYRSNWNRTHKPIKLPNPPEEEK